MRKIKLSQGKYAIVDDADFEWLNSFNWHITSHNYAETQKDKQRIYMHRLVNGTPKGIITDHINRNTLDNRRSNLRTADKRINSINRGLQANNTSGCKGVSWDKRYKKWEAYIWQNGTKIFLGYFEDSKKAISVRKMAEEQYHAI